MTRHPLLHTYLAVAAFAAALGGPLPAQEETPTLAPWSFSVVKTVSTSEGACSADFRDADNDGDPDGALYLVTKLAYCANDGDATYSATEHPVTDPNVELCDTVVDGCHLCDDDSDGATDDCVVAGCRTDTGECTVGRYTNFATTPTQRWVIIPGAYNPTTVASVGGTVLIGTLGDFFVGGGGGLYQVRADDTVVQVSPDDEKTRDLKVANGGTLVIRLAEDHSGGIRVEFYLNDGSNNFSKTGQFTSAASGETAGGLSASEDNGRLVVSWYRYGLFPPQATLEFARRVSGDGSQPSHYFFGTSTLGSIPTYLTVRDNERLSIASTSFLYRDVVDVTTLDAQFPILEVQVDVTVPVNFTNASAKRVEITSIISPDPCTVRLVRGAYAASRARGVHDCFTLGATGIHAVAAAELRSHRIDFGPASSSLVIDTANPLVAGQRGAIRVRGGPSFGFTVIAFLAAVAPTPFILNPPTNTCQYNGDLTQAYCYIPTRLDQNGERDLDVSVPTAAAGGYVDTQAIGLGGQGTCFGVYDTSNSCRDYIGNGTPQ